MMSSAVLVEPLAAALHAVKVIDLRPRDTVAVLGPRRLGMLMIAALQSVSRGDGAADFRSSRSRVTIRLLGLAGDLGADQAVTVHGNGDHLDDLSARHRHRHDRQPAGSLARDSARAPRSAPEVDARSPGRGRQSLDRDGCRRTRAPAVLPEDIADAAHGSPRTPLAWLASVDPPAALLARGAVIRGDGFAR